MTQTATVVLAEGFDDSVRKIATEEIEKIVFPEQPDVQKAIDQFAIGVESFNALRGKAPRFAGERVYLRSWNAGNFTKGGGWFTGYLTKQADDGGYVASNGGNYHWRRDEAEIDNLTILDFGAVADGTTDDSPAAKRMLDFCYSPFAKSISIHSGRVGIRLPSGSVKINPIDLTDKGELPEFVIYAPFTVFGILPLTTVTSDCSDNPVFKIKARRMSVQGVNWDGQQTTPINRYNKDTNPTGTNMLVGATLGIFNDTATNKQSFLKNICPGGEYVRITNFRAYRTGGVVFDLLDTLDTKLDQIYGSYTAAPFVTAGWSNQQLAAWDHSTALELSNANFQFPMAPAIYAPRCAQSIFDNVWFEHGSCPFDINNGHFRMTNVSVEDCTINPVAWKARLNIQGWSGPTGNKLDITTKPTDASWPSYPLNPDGSTIAGWLSGYEDGSFELEHYGARYNCPVRVLWSEGAYRGQNNTGSAVWVKLCNIASPSVGQIWELDVLAKNGYSGLRASPRPTLDGSAGKTTIKIQRGSGANPIVTMSHEGSNGVIDAQFYPSYNTGIEVWIKVAAWCGEFAAYAKSTGITRYDAGICSQISFDGTQQAAAPGFTSITPMFSLHNGKAGVGAYGDTLAIDTAVINSSLLDMTKVGKYIKFTINGETFGIPAYAALPTS